MMPPAAVRSQPKGWLATFAVLVLMVGIVGGGLAAASAVANIPNKPVAVAHGVVVTPPAEWSYAGRSDDGSTILLTQGVGSVAVMAADGTDVRAALTKLRDEWAATGNVAVGEIKPVTDVRGGAAGTLRFAYSGTFPDETLAGQVEGEVTGVAGTRALALFDAWAATGHFVGIRGDVLAIIDRATIP